MSALLIDPPRKLILVGMNYRAHAEESGLDVPSEPLLMPSWPTAMIGPNEPIVIPALTKQVDYEAELAVVIGKHARHVSPDRALEVVRGYTAANDISARDMQTSGQWSFGKSFDTFCPIGPRLVPRDEIPDPQALRIRSFVNGEVRQDASTSGMIFGVAELIAYASQAVTLEPGDVIFTGTPAGSESGRRKPRWLRNGDTVSIEIEGIGTLSNPVVEGESCALRLTADLSQQ
jgi:2-keto-4-pentenoate hydratase/2-oxohepta-3-ene-1,7-dioic acid hydratase in catechol pathway